MHANIGVFFCIYISQYLPTPPRLSCVFEIEETLAVFRDFTFKSIKDINKTGPKILSNLPKGSTHKPKGS